MSASMVLYTIAWWANIALIIMFVGMEVYWFMRKGKTLVDVPSAIIAFFIYNVPFVLLLISMNYQHVPFIWLGSLRLITIGVCAIPNFWLHYHSDKSGDSVGVFLTLYFLISIVLVVVTELCVLFL